MSELRRLEHLLRIRQAWGQSMADAAAQAQAERDQAQAERDAAMAEKAAEESENETMRTGLQEIAESPLDPISFHAFAQAKAVELLSG